MAEELSRKAAQRGTNNIVKWGVALAAVVFVALLTIFILGPNESQTPTTNTAPAQNKGGNAPTDTLPPAGTQKDVINGGTKLPEGQQ